MILQPTQPNLQNMKTWSCTYICAGQIKHMSDYKWPLFNYLFDKVTLLGVCVVKMPFIPVYGSLFKRKSDSFVLRGREFLYALHDGSLHTFKFTILVLSTHFFA